MLGSRKALLAVIGIVATVGLLFYLSIPQSIWALRNLYVSQNAPATQEQVTNVKARQAELAKENERLKAALDAAAKGAGS